MGESEARDAVCPGQDEAPVVVFAPELGVCGDGVQALADECCLEEGSLVDKGEDADDEFVRELGEVVVCGRLAASFRCVGGRRARQAAFRGHCCRRVRNNDILCMRYVSLEHAIITEWTLKTMLRDMVVVKSGDVGRERLVVSGRTVVGRCGPGAKRVRLQRCIGFPTAHAGAVYSEPWQIKLQ